MKVGFFLALLMSITVGQAQAQENAGSVGQIRGSVNFCGSGGVEGMRIYIPGHNYVLYTGTDGNFSFHNVEFGEYQIKYVINGQVLNHNKVSLNSKLVDLGQIAFCEQAAGSTQAGTTPAGTIPAGTTPAKPVSKTGVDQDKDGFDASRDCDDNNAAIRPGAVELCDGLDNNCNGKVDDGTGLSKVDNGLASCERGVLKLLSCQKGYADCDGELKNGCEIDTMRDSDNCGACNNFCGGEVCAMGTC